MSRIEPPRIETLLVVGCGAIGGLYAAALSDAARVVAFDLDAAHVAAIRRDGLRITGVTEHTARIEAHSDPAELDGLRADAVLFLVKSAATGPALRAVAGALTRQPLLVTLQNGMGNSEALAASGLPVARGVTMAAARALGPGRVEHLIAGPTSIGPVQGTLDDVRPFADLLAAGGIEVALVSEPMDAVWTKFVFNSVMNPIGALVLGVNAARYEVPEVRDLIDAMAAECVAVVEALGGHLAGDPLAPVRKIRSGAVPISRHAGSMALDMARGVPTEIDELTGYVVREGARLGIPVPICRTVYGLVKGMELARARGAAYGQG